MPLVEVGPSALARLTHNALLEYEKQGSTFVIITLKILMDFNIFQTYGNRNECPLQEFSNVCTKPEFIH